MHRFARLLALPLLILALLAQGYAPARAAAMPRDAFGQPICTADMGAAQRKGPVRAPSHDCCAAACHAASRALHGPGDPGVTLVAPAAGEIVRTFRARLFAPRGPPARFAEARGPPTNP